MGRPKKKITGKDVNEWQPETWSTERQEVSHYTNRDKVNISVINYTDGTVDVTNTNNFLTFKNAEEQINLLFIALAKIAILQDTTYKVWYSQNYGSSFFLAINRLNNKIGTLVLDPEHHIVLEMSSKYLSLVEDWCEESYKYSELNMSCRTESRMIGIQSLSRFRNEIEEFFFGKIDRSAKA